MTDWEAALRPLGLYAEFQAEREFWQTKADEDAAHADSLAEVAKEGVRNIREEYQQREAMLLDKLAALGQRVAEIPDHEKLLANAKADDELHTLEALKHLDEVQKSAREEIEVLKRWIDSHPRTPSFIEGEAERLAVLGWSKSV